MIDYQQPMFRPPSEANSLLIQATIGCSHNSCTYCAMYRQSNQKFRMRKKDEIFKIIDERSSTDFKRSFIADGNALVSLHSFYQRLFYKFLIKIRIWKEFPCMEKCWRYS